MVVVTLKESIVGGRLLRLGALVVIVILLLTALHVDVFEVGTLVGGYAQSVPRRGVIVPGVLFPLLPGVERT